MALILRAAPQHHIFSPGPLLFNKGFCQLLRRLAAAANESDCGRVYTKPPWLRKSALQQLCSTLQAGTCTATMHSWLSNSRLLSD